MKLSVENITKTFNGNGRVNTVLSNVSVHITKGEFVSLLGPSGCGKTTLLTIIAGFQQADQGTVRLNGAPVRTPGPDRGFVFQDFALFPWMTVQDNILFPMKQQKVAKRERNERLAQLLDMARLTQARHLYPSQISGGMKQRAAVVRALASDPRILLMDEPFGAVDYQMRHALQEEFEALWLKNRKPVVMVTHDAEEAIFLSDRILVMSADQGAIAHDVAIDLPRPRNREHRQFQDRLTHLTGLLKALRQTT